MVFWEQGVDNATVPRHSDAVLLSRRHDLPPAIVAFCLDRGELTVDLHVLSSHSIYFEANALVTMPLPEPPGVQLLVALRILGWSMTPGSCSFLVTCVS
jgi:hypothetical protein